MLSTKEFSLDVLFIDCPRMVVISLSVAQDLDNSTIYEDIKLREEMGTKGQEAVINRYNRREESRRLSSLYENLAVEV